MQNIGTYRSIAARVDDPLVPDDAALSASDELWALGNAIIAAPGGTPAKVEVLADFVRRGWDAGLAEQIAALASP